MKPYFPWTHAVCLLSSADTPAPYPLRQTYNTTFPIYHLSLKFLQFFHTLPKHTHITSYLTSAGTLTIARHLPLLHTHLLLQDASSGLHPLQWMCTGLS